MMIVKAASGGGAWEMWEATHELRFLGPQNVIAVPSKHSPKVGGYAYGEDTRFPWADSHHVIELFDTDAEGNPVDELFVRWVTWRDRNDRPHILITDGPVYICNERGDTVERLQPAGG